MEYKKITQPGYNLHMIKTDKFKTVEMHINFRRPVSKEDITKRLFLASLLFRTNDVYKTIRDVNLAAEEQYVQAFHAFNNLNGNHTTFKLLEVFINDQYTEPMMNQKALTFLLDILFKPTIINGGFDQREMDIVSTNLEKQILSLKENPSLYAYLKMVNIMEPNNAFSYQAHGYLDDLKKITPQNLYAYYLDLIKNDMVDIFVCGNIDSDIIVPILDSYFKDRFNHELVDNAQIEHQNLDQIKTIKEKMAAEQSKLLIGYKTKDLTNFEARYVLPLFSNILGGGADSKLFKNVREKNSLCYTIRSNSVRIYSLFYISSGISAINYDKALKLINLEFEKMKHGHIEFQDLATAKKSLINDYKDMLDNKGAMIHIYEDIVYYHGASIEEDIINLEEVTLSDITAVSHKLHLDTVFLLEGVKDNA